MTEELCEKIRAAIAGCGGWIKFLGVIHIVYGAISCATIVGAVTGWIPIWMGIVLLRASRSLAQVREKPDEAALMEYMKAVNKYFRIAGIMFVCSLLLGLIIGLTALAYSVAIQQKVVEEEPKAGASVGGKEVPKIKVLKAGQKEWYKEIKVAYTDEVKITDFKDSWKLPNGKTAVLNMNIVIQLGLEQSGNEKQKISREDLEILKEVLGRETQDLIKRLKNKVREIDREDLIKGEGNRIIREYLKEECNKRLKQIDLEHFSDKTLNREQVRDVFIVYYSYHE